MAKGIEDRTLALAGVFQAVEQVQQVARHGTLDTGAVEPVLASIFVTDPRTTAEVYGGVRNLRNGLLVLRRQLGTGGERDVELMRYAIALLHLGGKVLRRPDMLATIGQGIERARRQRDHFPLTHENVIAGLADIYVNTVSMLTPRILVTGEQGYLSQESNASRVRALLLAGIRSAILWKQSGGSRLGLIFRRNAYLEATEGLLAP